MSKEITLVKEVAPVVKEAKKLKIVKREDMKVAVEILSKLNQFNDKIKEEREKITKPLNEALRAERARWKPVETQNEEAIAIVREKMAVYQTEAERERREKEQAIAKRIGEGKGKLLFETAVAKIEGLETVEKEVATEAGLVQFRETKVLKITDVSQIPDKYWIVDEKAVFEALKAGVEVDGAELEIKMVPVNYR